MGSRNRDADEEPAHHVVITEDFWMSETSVTQAQFDVWTKLHQIEHAHHFSGNPNHPAENVTWHQATDFCRCVAANERISSACLTCTAMRGNGASTAGTLRDIGGAGKESRIVRHFR